MGGTLGWLLVCLTGCTQKALHQLPGPVASSYALTRDALKTEFKPESRHEVPSQSPSMPENGWRRVGRFC